MLLCPKFHLLSRIHTGLLCIKKDILLSFGCQLLLLMRYLTFACEFIQQLRICVDDFWDGDYFVGAKLSAPVLTGILLSELG
jgi:hypothetical protein